MLRPTLRLQQHGDRDAARARRREARRRPATSTRLSTAQRSTSTWDASTDNVGVTGYKIYRDDALLDEHRPYATSYTDTAPPAGDRSYVVNAVDAAGNLSDPSNTATATVPDTDEADRAQNLKATAAGSSQVDLSWRPPPTTWA